MVDGQVKTVTSHLATARIPAAVETASAPMDSASAHLVTPDLTALKNCVWHAASTDGASATGVCVTLPGRAPRATRCAVTEGAKCTAGAATEPAFATSDGMENTAPWKAVECFVELEADVSWMISSSGDATVVAVGRVLRATFQWRCHVIK